KLRIPEILAPAGGREQFFAALHAGADAVYLGLEKFNARARAQNFSLEDLSELLPIARRYGMRVLLTLNVVIKENEVAELVKTLARLEPLGIHALIIQDLGLARLVKNHFPSFRLHASTQMAVHNLAGVIVAKQLGFKRVVLARELTAVEIRKIRDALPEDEVQLEAFCHGSLCYSYSGLCFFSGARDARSGNRGECAYTCRKPYKILNEKGQGFLFSMRDLDTSADLKDLAGSGIDALKIEGRKKTRSTWRRRFVFTGSVWTNGPDIPLSAPRRRTRRANSPLTPSRSKTTGPFLFNARERLFFSKAATTKMSSTSTSLRTAASASAPSKGLNTVSFA
ncbi:MAG: U32 family peptidase, partial [Spirochaetia bacterium]|nr:U32 family peptidase [Spirochaetia bacterium]